MITLVTQCCYLLKCNGDRYKNLVTHARQEVENVFGLLFSTGLKKFQRNEAPFGYFVARFPHRHSKNGCQACGRVPIERRGEYYTIY